MGTRTHPDDQILAQLRVEFPGWLFWRAVKADGRLGEWVATRHDLRVGVSATVMQPTPGELRATLVEEARLAESKGL